MSTCASHLRYSNRVFTQIVGWYRRLIQYVADGDEDGERLADGPHGGRVRRLHHVDRTHGEARVDKPSKTASGNGTEAETQLRQANRALVLLSRCNSAVVHATDEDALLNEMCRIAVESAGYRLAWVGRAENDPERTVTLVTYAGHGEFLRDVRVSWGVDPYGQGVVGHAIRERRAATMRDVQHDPRFAAWRTETTNEGLASAIAVPVFVGHEVYGAWAVYASEPDAFDATEIGLLEELGASIAHGITAIRASKARAEADLVAGQLLDRLRRAQSVAQIGSWELDLSTQMMWGSEEAFRIYGVAITPNQILPRAEIRNIPLPEYRPILDRLMVDLLKNRGKYDVEFTIQRQSDRALRSIHSCGELACDDNGLPSKIIGTIHDITSSKQLEQQFFQAQKMESVGRLAGGIAHDFNNLLTVIQSCASLLSSDLPADHPSRADIEEIQKAAARAADLTRQLLAFSRKQVLEPRVLDLNEVVVGAERMLRRIIGEDIELVTIAAPDLALVSADRGAIEQVILNLAINARDAMPRGGTLTLGTQTVELTSESTSDHPEVTPGVYAILFMTDTGIGMDAATRSHIFEPFFTTKKDLGTGLGLSTVYGIVHQSGGHVSVYSEPDRGTTFRVYIPRIADETAHPAASSKVR